MLREAILRSIDLRRSKLYEIAFYDSNQPRTLGRVRTRDEELIYGFVKYTVIVPEARESITENEQMILVDTVPPCDECCDSEFEDKEQCLLEGECHQDTSFSIDWKEIRDTAEEREFRLITGENLYWDLTLLTKAELKLLKSDPEKNWIEADKKCRASNWHLLTESLGLDEFFKRLGAKHHGDLDLMIEEETTEFSPVKKN